MDSQALIELLDHHQALRERVDSLEDDVARYRELAIVGFDTVRTLTLRLERVTVDRDRLRDDYRRLRDDVLIRAGADDEAAA